MSRAHARRPSHVIDGDGPAMRTMTYAAFIARLVRDRRDREDMLGAAVFADPAWDALLDLMAAHEAGRSVTVPGLALAAHVPGTVALRWIDLMVEEGLLVRRADPKTPARVTVELSPVTHRRLCDYLDLVAGRWGIALTAQD